MCSLHFLPETLYDLMKFLNLAKNAESPGRDFSS